MTRDGGDATGTPEPVREWEASVFAFLDARIPTHVADRGARTVADVLASTVAGSAAPPYDDTWVAMDLPDGRVEPAHTALDDIRSRRIRDVAAALTHTS
jgi:hypothetical protein